MLKGVDAGALSFPAAQWPLWPGRTSLVVVVPLQEGCDQAEAGFTARVQLSLGSNGCQETSLGISLFIEQSNQGIMSSRCYCSAELIMMVFP